MIPFVISAALLLSCEDVIQVELNNAAPRIVIEGSISNISDSVIVLMHRSTDYFTPSSITPVNDAEAVIVDTSGIPHPLINVADGIYALGNFHSAPGDVLGIVVTDAGVKYSATSTMPFLVNIESVFIDKNPDRPDEDRINILIKDPAEIANYYMIEVFRNDTLLNTGNHFILYSDKYFNGKTNYLQVTAGRLDIKTFSPGDSVRVRLLNIDRTMYDYFDILRRITEDYQILSVASPANPPNNFDNGALGYFTAWSISEKTITVN
jgi:hypothetical protein